MGTISQSVTNELEQRGIANSAIGRIAINLANRLDTTAEDKEAASIAKELRAIMEKVEAMPTKQGDSVDDLTAQRKARRANASNS